MDVTHNPGLEEKTNFKRHSIDFLEASEQLGKFSRISSDPTASQGLRRLAIRYYELRVRLLIY
jgi:hypothetical protein